MFTVGVVCDIGVGALHGGRERNEDSTLLCLSGRVSIHGQGEVKTQEQAGEGLLVAVCDGMGGHDNGHVASSTATRVLARLFQPGSPARPARILLKYLLEAHRQLHWAARRDGPVSMGTTVTAAWFLNGEAAWVNVGDSRLYLYRGERLARLSHDQTRNEFARRDNRPQTPEGNHLAQNFIFGSRGLGDNACLRLEKGLDSGSEPLRAGDRLLLCSDGLTSVVEDHLLAEALARFHDPQEACDQLHAMAIKQGSRDNISAVVVRVDGVPVKTPTEDPDDTVQF